MTTVPISVDLARRSAQDHLVRVQWKMKDPGRAGVGTSGEWDISDDALLYLTDKLEAIGGVLVGRRAGAGEWTVIGYMPESGKTEIVSILQAAPIDQNMQVLISKDPKWDYFETDVFPHRPMDRYQVLNQLTVRRLRERDEDIESPHTVEHVLYLPSAGATDVYCDWAARNGFSVRRDHMPPPYAPAKEGETAVCLERVEPKVNEVALNAVMYVIVHELEKVGGEYAGAHVVFKLRLSEWK